MAPMTLQIIPTMIQADTSVQKRAPYHRKKKVKKLLVFFFCYLLFVVSMGFGGDPWVVSKPNFLLLTVYL